MHLSTFPSPFPPKKVLWVFVLFFCQSIKCQHPLLCLERQGMTVSPGICGPAHRPSRPTPRSQPLPHLMILMVVTGQIICPPFPSPCRMILSVAYSLIQVISQIPSAFCHLVIISQPSWSLEEPGGKSVQLVTQLEPEVKIQSLLKGIRFST